MDRIGNLLTSLRNAELAGHSKLVVPHAKLSEAVLANLKKAGYISEFKVTGEKNSPIKTVAIELPTPVARHHYKRLSTPGRRLYTTADRIPRVLRGLGDVIITTSKGVMLGKEARKHNLGGELICEIY
jgi:small subunit ribosomal protein S8